MMVVAPLLPPGECEAKGAGAGIRHRGVLARRMRVPAEPADGTPASVTVVIPCYNYGRFLPGAVDSALSQVGVTVDVVIVDDASPDGSAAVAAGLAKGDARIRVLYHAINKGAVATFNDGLALARGEFLVRLDADDLLTPGSLRRSVDVMRVHPSIGLVYGHPLHFTDGEPLPRHRHHVHGWTLWPGRQWLADCCRSGYNVITSPEVVLRRSIVDDVGGQKPLAHTHDMEMWLRVSAFCDVAYIHGSDQAWHREHANSLSAREVDSHRDLLERRDAFQVLFSGVVGSIAEVATLETLSRQAIARHAVELAKRHYDRGNPDPVMVAMLREIARAQSPQIEESAAWAGLDRRMAIGAAAARRHPAYIIERALRATRARVSRARWNRTGVW